MARNLKCPDSTRVPRMYAHTVVEHHLCPDLRGVWAGIRLPYADTGPHVRVLHAQISEEAFLDSTSISIRFPDP